MGLPDTSNRLKTEVTQHNLNALRGAKGIADYAPSNPDASLDYLSELESKMRHLYELEVQMKAQHKALLDDVRELEWKFHQGIQSLKASVIAQYGRNSTQLEALGYKKLEDYKRPNRKKSSDESSN